MSDDYVIDWSDLLDALHQDECVLLLGPRTATYQGECLCDLLGERLALLIHRRGLEIRHGEADYSLMTRLFIEQFRNPTDALEQLGKTLRYFYSEFIHETIPVFDLIAQLPFKYIINTSPDNLLVEALARHDKHARFFDFHYNKPEYNLEVGRKAVNLDDEISEDAPLVFNLLGHYDRPDSLVLTDAARLSFLEVVLQREKEATLPPNISYFFTKPPLKRLRKAYIFIGFDFNEWHMRLFLHLLRRAHGELLPQSLTLQDRSALRGDAGFFFTENFNMHFVGNNPIELLHELQEHLRKPLPKAPPPHMELLLLFHPDDEVLRKEFEIYLAPLRHGGLVDIWHEQQIAPGADIDATLREHLASARLIVPLLTANFMANERLFADILPVILERHHSGSAKLAPVVMTPCDVENTPFFDLITLNPKPRGKAVSQKPDRAEALVSVVDDLHSMIDRMLQNTSTSSIS